MSAERYARQSGVLDPNKLSRTSVAVMGCGAVGRQLALQLASSGQRGLHLYDHDRIEEVNLGPQSWPAGSVGELKVDHLAEQINAYYPDAEPIPHSRRCPLTGVTADVLFFCVDSISTRGRLWEAYRDRVIFDARVAGEIIRLISVTDDEQRAHYPDTLFSSGEAMQASCTTRMTVFSANIAAGLLMEQYSKWLRELPLDRDTLVNLLAMVMIQK